MATIRTRALRDGTPTHSVLFRLDGRQTSETFDTLAAARAFIRDLDKHGPDTARRLLDSRRGLDHAPERTVAEQVQAHIDALSGITLGTRRRYEVVARGIAAHRLGALPLSSVRSGDVAAWVLDQHRQGASSATIELRRAVLSGAMKRALHDELVVRNPVTGVKIPRTEQKERTFLTHEEFATLLRHATPLDRPLLFTLAGTGLRIGEATALQVRDLHLSDVPPTLTVSRGWQETGGPRVTGAPKTERGRRTIALPEQVYLMLREHVRGKAAGEWVFANPDGRPMHRVGVNRRWGAAVRAARIGKKPRVHDLRHSHASWLIAAGVPLTTIQHRLGHASIKVTSDVYGHLMPESQVQAARAANLALGRQHFAQDTPLIGQA